MKLNQLTRSRVVAVVAGGAAIAVLGSSVGYAANTIRSSDIVNGTIRSVDIKNGTIQTGDLTAGARAKLQGQRGPAGPQGPAGPAGGSTTVVVKDLQGLWKARAADTAGVTMTGDGVRFGPFANGGGCTTPGVDFGRLDFSGLNGKPLSSVTSLVYHARYTATNDTGGVGSPTMRVSIDDPTTDGPDRLTFSPNTQLDGDFAEGAMHEWIVTSGTVRLNDDAGSDPAGEKPWSEYVAQLGSRLITNIDILNGCQAGTNLTGLVRKVEVNGVTFAFGAN
ncbi:hypothetical protein [Nocardioides litoris]|uniref:hypothetical protein n=1 Tax=Nocardioides litoris TaxID=1926648 RepID=UPI0011249216|nr:hypothetical protein [Nocardioides litoris]